MMVKLKDQNQYRSKGGESVSAITDALNEEVFRGSLKEAYGGRSMQQTLRTRIQAGGRNAASDDTRDTDSDDVAD